MNIFLYYRKIIGTKEITESALDITEEGKIAEVEI